MSHYAIRNTGGVGEVRSSVLGPLPRMGDVLVFDESSWAVVSVEHRVATDSCGVTCSTATVYVERDRSEDVP